MTRIAQGLLLSFVGALFAACHTPNLETTKAAQMKRPKITPQLMFTGDAEAAITHYVGLFDGGTIVSISRFGPDGPGAEGSVMQAEIEIGGQRLLVTDSPAVHEFTFTPSISLFVDCESVEEHTRLFEGLSGGSVQMPPDDYGFSRRFAFVTDEFGVYWQINLP